MNEAAALPVPARPAGDATFVIAMGVLLPLIALAFEAGLGVFSDAAFNPLPTPFHIALIASVPLANAMLARFLLTGRTLLPRVFPLLHGFAVGTSLLYTILFLPLTPFAMIGVLFFGIGLIPLAPLMSLAAAMFGRASFKRITGAQLPRLWQGMALALIAFIALDLPATSTRVGMALATAEDPATRLQGVRWLRLAGNEDSMLRLCQPQSGSASGMIGSLVDVHRHLSPEQARAVVYRVTGASFNSHPVPHSRNPYTRFRNGFDFERGGEIVGQRLAGVSLDSSRIDGSLDAKAALGYLEWTMVFKNDSPQMQEGRAELLLPHGAVVSRATLWIDGEEREAAFGGRGQVRAAYEKVVKQSRDPLLVTTAGRDRVLIQLFPIQARGTMKIRIGISTPMVLRDLQHARLELPSFSERNFEIAPALRHAVWVESKTAIEGGPGLRSEQVSDKLFALRGELADTAASGIEAARPASAAPSWSSDDMGGNGGNGALIVQTLSEQPVPALRRVAVVIDGSLPMQAIKAQLVETLAALPSALEVAYVFAGDDRPHVVARDPGDALAARRYLEQLEFAGGRDNTDALVAAWDWASATSTGAIVWIHGTQPDMQGATDALLQRYERRPGQVPVYDVEAAAGANSIARKLDGHASLQRVARSASLGDDLRQLFSQWEPGALRIATLRERQAGVGQDPAAKTSSHLVRLWAAEQVAAASLDPKQHAAAVAMATRYQLVTPVSGAVVLETKQQYDEAGLEPVPPGSVPTIPEPETWLLIIVALSVLALRYRKRRA